MSAGVSNLHSGGLPSLRLGGFGIVDTPGVSCGNDHDNRRHDATIGEASANPAINSAIGRAG
jgi:hypothetical protein